MSEIWNTKYGRRRVRFDPPTLREAIAAAQGLTGDLEQQAEIAAALMAVPVEDVRTELLIMAPDRNSEEIVTSSGRDGGARTVIVQRKPSRQFGARLEVSRLGPATRPAARPSSGGDRQGSRTLLRLGLLDRKPVPS
jgi:hypothetical protein